MNRLFIVNTQLQWKFTSSKANKGHKIIYLFNESDVSGHTCFKLSSTSRKDKIITRLPNPVLVLLVFH